MSAYLSVWPPICLLVYPPICLSIHLSVYQAICLSPYLSVSQSACPSVCLSVRLSVCLSACLSVCISVCLHVCLSVCLSVCMYVCMCVCLPDYLAAGLNNGSNGERQTSDCSPQSVVNIGIRCQSEICIRRGNRKFVCHNQQSIIDNRRLSINNLANTGLKRTQKYCTVPLK
jgi:hypothetical protein